MSDEKQIVVFNEILLECDRQHSKVVGWSMEHDDNHSIEDFSRFIANYANWAGQKASQDKMADARKRMIQVAAMAVQCVLSIDRRSIIAG